MHNHKADTLVPIAPVQSILIQGTSRPSSQRTFFSHLSGTAQVFSNLVLWLGTASILVALFFLALPESLQPSRVISHLLFLFGNIIWIRFAIRIRSAQLLFLHSVFLGVSLVGLVLNLPQDSTVAVHAEIEQPLISNRFQNGVMI